MAWKGESRLWRYRAARQDEKGTEDVTIDAKTCSPRMRKYFSGFAAAALMVLLAAAPAAAQWASGTTGMEYRPRLSTSEEIAMAQHVLSGVAPSADDWARSTKEYQEANEFDRQTVMEEQRRVYIDKFKLYVRPEVLVVGARVQLSPYSEINKGFIIESFTDQTFFAYSFAGQNYAVVIPKLMDYQWIGIEKEFAKPIIDARTAQSKHINVVIEFEPKFGDQNPIELQGKQYRLLAGEVASISLYGYGSDRVLWSRNGIGRGEKNRSSIINLQGKN